MALDLPSSADELIQKSKTDFQKNVTESNPFLKNAWVAAFLAANSHRVFDLYLTVEQLEKQVFPHTATGVFLDIHASIWGVTRNPEIGSSGSVVVTGLSGTTIPLGSTLQNSSGKIYKTTTELSISQTVLTTTLTRSGFTVTATTGEHNLSSNVVVAMGGADEAAYNGFFAITVISPTQFTYTITSQPATPATGTIITAFLSALVPISSQDFGQDTVISPDEILSFIVTIAGIDSDASADVNGIIGGTDLEEDEDFRVRLLRRIANPVTNFNEGQVEFEARKIPGVTRVFIFSTDPTPGSAKVYFVRDGDENIIPSDANVELVSNALQAIRPVDMDPENLKVSGPTSINADGSFSKQNFLFRSLSPDTPTMRTAVTDSLTEFFRDGVTMEVDVEEIGYQAAIIRTVDPTTGETLKSFFLDSPQGDIPVAKGQLVMLGLVIFP